MNKQELTLIVKESIARGELTSADIKAVYEESAGSAGASPVVSRNISITEVLYYIGGLIVLIGIVVMLGQNWEALNSISRILVTLGSSLVLFVSGALLFQNDSFKKIGQVFWGLSMFLMPIGFMVLFNELDIEYSKFGPQSLIAGAMFIIAIAAMILFRTTLFTGFSIAFGTWLYYSVAGLIIQNNRALYDFHIYQYLTMIIGITYVLLGNVFSKKSEEYLSSLTGKLYTFGLIGLLGAAVSLDGFWEVIFPGLVFAVIFLSVYLRSKAFLWVGSIFVMIYIIKITSKYFSEGLGWPLSLVLAGLALIGVGYVTFYLNKKYITGNERI